MIIFDLFSGTGSSTQAFKDAGHTVISFEIDGNFVATQHVNILNLKAEDLIAKYGRPDFIWASPPCTPACCHCCARPATSSSAL